MAQVAVVTDTTHYLPRALLRQAGVAEVSLYVNEGERTERESAMADFDGFYDRLRGAGALPAPSPPPTTGWAALGRCRRPRSRRSAPSWRSTSRCSPAVATSCRSTSRARSRA